MDRAALQIVRDAEEDGRLRPSQTVVEMTSACPTPFALILTTCVAGAVMVIPLAVSMGSREVSVIVTKWPSVACVRIGLPG